MARESTSRPVFARLCATACPWMDRGGLAEHRGRLLAGLSGRVVEVGAGSGMNFHQYPRRVTSLVAVEPEPYLCRFARHHADRAAPVPVHVVEGVAERLPFGDGSFDAAVVTLTLCTVPDPAAALGETFRVLRPGGTLHFLEHVRADTPGLARVQRLLDATLWPVFFGGCHTARDSTAAVTAAGFTLRRLEPLWFPDLRVRLPTSPHVLGVAVRPDSSGPTAE